MVTAFMAFTVSFYGALTVVMLRTVLWDERQIVCLHLDVPPVRENETEDRGEVATSEEPRPSANRGPRLLLFPRDPDYRAYLRGTFTEPRD